MLDPTGVVGLVTIDRLEHLPRDQLERTAVSALADPDPTLLVDERGDIAELLARPSFQRVGRAIVTGAGGRIGIISVTEVERALRASRLTSAGSDPRRSDRPQG